MKGPEARRARPLAERFADLQSRIQALEAKGRAATPGEHTVADLINDLRNRCDTMRGHLTGLDETAAAHHAARGTAATSASTKSPSDQDQDAEAAFRDLERAYERALTRMH
ncbi:MAG: hypothetical protein WCZ23_11550 [Rhodospirillaceae bacterium]